MPIQYVLLTYEKKWPEARRQRVVKRLIVVGESVSCDSGTADQRVFTVYFSFSANDYNVAIGHMLRQWPT